MTDNEFSIKLRDDEQNPHYLSAQSIDELKKKLPITVIINDSDKRLTTQVQSFSYTDVFKTGTLDPKDPTTIIYQAGNLQVGGSSDNKVKFKLGYVGADPDDHSQLVMKLNPFTDGTYWIHVFLGNEELEKSPLELRIIKSDEHRRQEDLEKSERDRLEALREARRREKARLAEEKRRKKMLDDEAKMRLQREKEEELKRKQEETRKRAEDLMKKAKEAREMELKLKEEERKYQKEMRTGGGFNLKKHQEMKAKLAQMEKEGGAGKE